MEVTITLPEYIARVFIANGETIERVVMEATAIEGYRTGRLSRSQVGRMLGLDRFEVDAFFKSHKVPLNYSFDDLESDRRALDGLVLK